MFVAPCPVGLRSWLRLHGRLAVGVNRSAQLAEIRSWRSVVWFVDAGTALRGVIYTGAAPTPEHRAVTATGTRGNSQYRTCSRQRESEGREASLSGVAPQACIISVNLCGKRHTWKGGEGTGMSWGWGMAAGARCPGRGLLRPAGLRPVGAQLRSAPVCGEE